MQRYYNVLFNRIVYDIVIGTLSSYAKHIGNKALLNEARQNFLFVFIHNVVINNIVCEDNFIRERRIIS
jgi:hypothetical protein